MVTLAMWRHGLARRSHECYLNSASPARAARLHLRPRSRSGQDLCVRAQQAPSSVDALDAQAIKQRFIRLAAGTDRGVSSGSQTRALLECVVQLEETAANPWVTLQLVDGDWKLAWSTVTAPERACSPLFWAVQSFTDTLTQQGTADLVFRLTDAIKGAVGLRYGAITQSIDMDNEQLVSNVELSVSPIPGMALKGTVRTTAKATVNDDAALELRVIETAVLDSPFAFLDDAAFPVEEAFTQLAAAHMAVRGGNDAGDADKVTVRTTFVDEDLRIGRLGDDVHVYLRALPS